MENSKYYSYIEKPVEYKNSERSDNVAVETGDNQEISISITESVESSNGDNDKSNYMKDNLNIKIEPINIQGPFLRGPKFNNIDMKIEDKDDKEQEQRFDRISITINSNKGCLINGNPYDPQNPPYGIQLFVDKKAQKSED